MSDDDLREAFQSLKSTEEELVPEFRIPEIARGDRWRWRIGVLASAGAAVAAIALLLLLKPPVEPRSAPMAAEIPFDEYSEVISRELFAASAGEWKSPTDFLMNFDNLTELER